MASCDSQSVVGYNVSRLHLVASLRMLPRREDEFRGGAERSEEVRRREFRSIGDNKTSDKLRNRMHKKRPGQTADGRVRVRY